MTKQQMRRVLGGMVTIFGFVGLLSTAGAYELDKIGFIEALLSIFVFFCIMGGGGAAVVKS